MPQAMSLKIMSLRIEQNLYFAPYLCSRLQSLGYSCRCKLNIPKCPSELSACLYLWLSCIYYFSAAQKHWRSEILNWWSSWAWGHYNTMQHAIIRTALTWFCTFKHKRQQPIVFSCVNWQSSSLVILPSVLIYYFHNVAVHSSLFVVFY